MLALSKMHIEFQFGVFKLGKTLGLKCHLLIVLYCVFNTYHAAGVSRRQKQHFTQKSNILEFHDHIWNHHEKCIQKSTNMPGIGSLIRGISKN